MLEVIMSYVKLALQFPSGLCLLIGSVILLDISRVLGCFMINQSDRCVAEVLRNNPKMRRVVIHDAINAVLTEISIIAVMSCLLLDNADKLLIIVIGLLSLILIHFMVSLYSLASYALEYKDELLGGQKFFDKEP